MTTQKIPMQLPSENLEVAESPMRNGNPPPKMEKEGGGPKKPFRSLPTKEHLNSLLDYNPSTGVLTWRRKPKEAGSKRIDNRYGRPSAIWVSLKVGGVRNLFPAHRLIMIMTGSDLSQYQVVDHINGDPFDNRLSNLRVATMSQNSHNNKRWRPGKYGLPKGVRRHRRKFIARIAHQGKLIFIGAYATALEAGQAWEAKAKELRGEFFTYPETF